MPRITKNRVFRIVLIALTFLILFALMSCRKDPVEPKNNKNCQENEFSGNWEFITNPNQANADTIYLDLDWVSNTYTINNESTTRGVINSYWVQYYNTSYTIQVDTKNCEVTYEGFKGKKI